MMTLNEQLNQKGFHCAHLNCRSLYNKIDILGQLMSTTDRKLHVLGLSETWLTEQLPDNIVGIDGYEITRNDRVWSQPNCNQVKKGGGVFLYVRDTLSWNNDNVKFLDRSENFIEIQWVEIVNDKSRNYIVANTYRPPDGSISDFKDYMEAALNSLDLTKFDVFIMGDFNLDYFDNKIPGVKDLKNLVKQFGFVQLVFFFFNLFIKDFSSYSSSALRSRSSRYCQHYDID